MFRQRIPLLESIKAHYPPACFEEHVSIVITGRSGLFSFPESDLQKKQAVGWGSRAGQYPVPAIKDFLHLPRLHLSQSHFHQRPHDIPDHVLKETATLEGQQDHFAVPADLQ